MPSRRRSSAHTSSRRSLAISLPSVVRFGVIIILYTVDRMTCKCDLPPSCIILWWWWCKYDTRLQTRARRKCQLAARCFCVSVFLSSTLSRRLAENDIRLEVEGFGCARPRWSDLILETLTHRDELAETKSW